MSNTRKPGDADNEKAMREANELDVEVSKALDSLNAALSDIPGIDEAVRAATPKPQIDPNKFITTAEYESLNATGGTFRSFTGPKVSAEDQKVIKIYKTELHGAGTDQDRYVVASIQRDSIYAKVSANQHVSGALKQYADELDNLIQNANTRALAAQHQARQKK